MPNWHFAQVFRPRRVLPSRVVNSAEEITMATPQKRRLLVPDARASVLCRLLGEVHRSKTQRRRYRRNASLKIFAGGTYGRPRGGFRRGNNGGEPADTATSLKNVAAIGLHPAKMKNTRGYMTEASAPRPHLVRLFRACLSSSLRVVNSAEQTTEVGRLTRGLVRFLRHRWCLLRPRGRFGWSENQGGSVQMA